LEDLRRKECVNDPCFRALHQKPEAALSLSRKQQATVSVALLEEWEEKDRLILYDEGLVI
jgi:hypothetical protein